MDKIIVCDNFLTEDELTTAKNIIFYKEWKFGHQTTHEKLYSTPFWSMELECEEIFSK